jgi:hypothetical protein
MSAVTSHEPHHDAETGQVIATIRRLKAALAPSTHPSSVPDEVVVHEIKRIIESEGLRNLLAHSEQGYFADVIRRVDDALSEGGTPRAIIERLWSLMDSRELNAALATDDPDEQPARLLELMLEGPYKNARS